MIPYDSDTVQSVYLYRYTYTVKDTWHDRRRSCDECEPTAYLRPDNRDIFRQSVSKEKL